MLNFETIQDWYQRGWMPENDVNQFLALGAITEEQANTILEGGGSLRASLFQYRKVKVQYMLQLVSLFIGGDFMIHLFGGSLDVVDVYLTLVVIDLILGYFKALKTH
ncbi:MAG: hypothetical protein ACLSIL_15985 [Enterococcus casseliflavus]